ncbi:hypothetical protein HMPREF9065_01415 [Aggregatibacter sp. oral taxon 458 str. W10330]|nr:hypothetical protein HMPREF9065_01415 [Aggregatibacter sp. oral taxon 458 str. W10330]
MNFAFQGIYLKIFSMLAKCGSKIRWIFFTSVTKTYCDESTLAAQS